MTARLLFTFLAAFTIGYVVHRPPVVVVRVPAIEAIPGLVRSGGAPMYGHK